MRFLVSFSNFKGSLTNEEACSIACEELRSLGHTATALPLGDGGKGTFAYLKSLPSVQVKTHSIRGAFGDPRTATSCWALADSGKQHVFLESTDAIGYPPADPEKRDPMGATSRGLGEWLLAIEKELKGSPCELFIGLGDSAISDAGKGLVEILGNRTFPQWKIAVLCDVENPLCGPNGSARVFSPQKGASPEQVVLLEKAHSEFADVVERKFGIDIKSMPRGGSAGGLASALYAYLGAELVSGAQFVLTASRFEAALEKHDCLIVGEGKTDVQTLSGKSPWVAIQLAEKLRKKSFLISGALGEGAEKIQASGLIAKIACGREPDVRTALLLAVNHALKALISQ